jgi:hypothetical protein
MRATMAPPTRFARDEYLAWVLSGLGIAYLSVRIGLTLLAAAN